jgi:hypothetical protein
MKDNQILYVQVYVFSLYRDDNSFIKYRAARLKHIRDM